MITSQLALVVKIIHFSLIFDFTMLCKKFYYNLALLKIQLALAVTFMKIIIF